MSPYLPGSHLPLGGGPRASGDEPKTVEIPSAKLAWSPRERG